MVGFIGARYRSSRVESRGWGKFRGGSCESEVKFWGNLGGELEGYVSSFGIRRRLEWKSIFCTRGGDLEECVRWWVC